MSRFYGGLSGVAPDVRRGTTNQKSASSRRRLRNRSPPEPSRLMNLNPIAKWINHLKIKNGVKGVLLKSRSAPACPAISSSRRRVLGRSNVGMCNNLRINEARLAHRDHFPPLLDLGNPPGVDWRDCFPWHQSQTVIKLGHVHNRPKSGLH
jgi:hypothetical protein